jgi:hypothetical protein
MAKPPFVQADLLQEYEAKIAALERMVGRQALFAERSGITYEDREVVPGIDAV